MIPPKVWRLVALAVFLAVAFGCGGGGVSNTQFSNAITQSGPAVAKEAVPGDKLNAYFPKDDGDWDDD